MSPAAKALRGPKNRAVTASRFRDARLACLLSVPAAAKLLRVTERTVQNWEAGRVRVPYAAFKLMRVLRGYELPDPAWRGFRVVGDTLWTPEGHPFRPDHMAWWSLTCRMADEFRRLAASRRAAEAGAEGSGSGLVSTETSDTRNDETQQIRGFQSQHPPACPVLPPASRLPGGLPLMPTSDTACLAGVAA